MGNLDLYNRYREVPTEAQKPIAGGRMRGMTDINPMWRIKCLTDAFGPCGKGWTYRVLEHWTEKCGEEVAAFVSIELTYMTDTGSWSMPVIGTGGSMLYVKEKNDLRLNDEAYKMATTDAISVACKQLGIGADVYWDKDRTKYSSPPEAVAAYPSRAEMMAVVIRSYPHDTKQYLALCAAFKVDDLNDASEDQIKAVYQKCMQKKKAS